MSDNTTLTVPIVHLNGSGKKNLTEGFCEAGRAVNEAIDELCKIRPHGRDYYIAEAGTYEKACREHEARIATLKRVSDELTALALAVDEQGR
jgi:hypothetical protein